MSDQWGAFQLFNDQLFGGILARPELTWISPNNVVFRGYVGGYSPSKHTIYLSELCLELPLQSIAQTIVHEMTHLWQHTSGHPPKRVGYHNREWANQMIEIGLHPSSTGRPGGRECGYEMGDYMITGGRFSVVFAEWRELCNRHDLMVTSASKLTDSAIRGT